MIFEALAVKICLDTGMPAYSCLSTLKTKMVQGAHCFLPKGYRDRVYDELKNINVSSPMRLRLWLADAIKYLPGTRKFTVRPGATYPKTGLYLNNKFVSIGPKSLLKNLSKFSSQHRMAVRNYGQIKMGKSHYWKHNVKDYAHFQIIVTKIMQSPKKFKGKRDTAFPQRRILHGIVSFVIAR